MLLSVVIPAWNRRDVIERSINSVLAQSLAGLEVIVVDNGSTDATAAFVDSIDDHRVRLLQLDANLGPSGARNAGLKACAGTYVAFLDSDDALARDWSDIVRYAERHQFGLVTSGFAMLDLDGRWRYDQASEPMGRAFYDIVGPFQAGTFVVRTEIARAIGGYADQLRYSENTEFALRLSKHCADRRVPVGHIDQPLLRWYHNPQHRYVSDTRMHATEYLLEHHGDQLDRDRAVLSSYRSQLGVWQARTGDLRSARHQFWAAWKARRRTWRNLGRLVLASNRLSAERVWPVSGS
jgi:glycosyltransferase involved in cell wall biosynthesis